MLLTNYHSHTRYSDGSSNPLEYIEQAIEIGFKAYGFSCHAPVTFPCKWTIAPEELDDYLTEIDSLKTQFANKLEIYKSLEIDYFPSNPLSQPENYQKLGLDYVIGSVHFVDNLKNGEAWNIDTSKRIFDDGMLEIFGGDGKKAVTKFYALTIEMLEITKPTIIGHLDKIKMFNIDNRYFSDNEQWYKDLLEPVLAKIAELGTIVEVNTRGLYRNKTKDYYPPDYVLTRCLELGIPVTINSDCHKPQEVALGITEAREQLKSLGFKSVRILLKNKWIDEIID